MIKKAKLNYKGFFHAPIFWAAYQKIFLGTKKPYHYYSANILELFRSVGTENKSRYSKLFYIYIKDAPMKKHSYSFELFVSFLCTLAFDYCKC